MFWSIQEFEQGFGWKFSIARRLGGRPYVKEWHLVGFYGSFEIAKAMADTLVKVVAAIRVSLPFVQRGITKRTRFKARRSGILVRN